MKKLAFAMLALTGLMLGGCETNRGTGALVGGGVGAAAGAGLGAIIGHNSGGHTATGAVIGAGVGAAGGAAAGYMIGNEQDKKKNGVTTAGGIIATAEPRLKGRR